MYTRNFPSETNPIIFLEQTSHFDFDFVFAVSCTREE